MIMSRRRAIGGWVHAEAANDAKGWQGRGFLMFSRGCGTRGLLTLRSLSPDAGPDSGRGRSGLVLGSGEKGKTKSEGLRNFSGFGQFNPR